MAVSVCGTAPFEFEHAVSFTLDFARRLLDDRPEHRGFYNVNVPNIAPSEIRGVRGTRLGIRTYGYGVERREDPRGNAYYWIGGGGLDCEELEGSDCDAVRDGYISITPLKTDWTDFAALDTLKSAVQAWFP